MPNILDEYNATSEQRIDDKTEIYSVTTGDVGSTIREGVSLALLYPQANILFTYPKDFITRDAGYNLFISLQDNVSGDTTNGADWQSLSSNASQSVYDLGVISDDFANGYEATVPSIVAYSTSNIYLFKPDNTNTGASTLQINALAILPIKKYSSSAVVDVESGDLDLANTYLLIYKTTYFLIASGGVSGGGGGSGDFASLTGSPYDNTNLGNALNSKQDRINGIVSGCEITVETFAGTGTNKRIRISKGAAITNKWYITPSEYSKLADTVSSEITLCPIGGDFKYYDIVADDSGAITIHEGTPSTSPAHYVIDPLTEVLLGFITVGDAVIEEPAVISDSLTKKFEGFGVLTGSFTLDCDSNDFPSFFFRLNGTAATLNFSNYWNVVEGTLYIDVNTTTILNLPTGSYESGSVITSKTLATGYYYRVTFGYLYGEYFWDFGIAGGGGANLGYTPSATDGIVTSDTGTDATIPLATPTAGTNLAGLLSPADKTKLDNTSNANSGDNATNTTSNAYADAKVENNLTASTTVAPSKSAVNTALALKANLTGGNTFTGTQTIDGSPLIFDGVNASIPAGKSGSLHTAVNKLAAFIDGATTFIINSTGIAFLAGKRIQGQLELSAIEVTNTAGTDNAFLQVITGLGTLALNAVGAATNIAVSLATKGTGAFSIRTNNVERVLVNGSTGQLTISNLAGTGERVNTSDPSGNQLSSYPIRLARTFNQVAVQTDAGNSSAEKILFNTVGAGDWLIPSARLQVGRYIDLDSLGRIYLDAGFSGDVTFRIRIGEAATALTSRTILYEVTRNFTTFGADYKLDAKLKVLSLGVSGSILAEMTFENTYYSDSVSGLRFKITTANTTVENLLTFTYQFDAAFADNKIESQSGSILLR